MRRLSVLIRFSANKSFSVSALACAHQPKYAGGCPVLCSQSARDLNSPDRIWTRLFKLEWPTIRSEFAVLNRGPAAQPVTAPCQRLFGMRLFCSTVAGNAR
jgi:hypothetical protein